MKSFRLIVSTPGGNVYDSEATKLFLRGAFGDLAILSDHAPIAALVKEGNLVIVKESGETLKCRCSDGFLTVKENETVLLTDKVEII